MEERRRRHGADQSLPRRSVPSKPPHGRRPGSCGGTGIRFRGSELLGLQVQGSGCPLQQRPSSEIQAHKVTPQSRGGQNGSRTLPGGPKERPEDWRSRTCSRPEKTPEGGGSAARRRKDPFCETAGTPTTPRAQKVLELHLYLPSSLCDEDEGRLAEAEDVRSSAEEPTSAQGSANPPLRVPTLHTDSRTRDTAPAQPTFS